DGGRARLMAGRSVGVVIAAFNARSTIDMALASVAAQISPADEVVLVDDASIDGTAEHALRWKEVLPLRIISLEANVGSGPARSSGIDALRTDLVALLDADDVILPDHLSVMTQAH